MMNFGEWSSVMPTDSVFGDDHYLTVNLVFPANARMQKPASIRACQEVARGLLSLTATVLSERRGKGHMPQRMLVNRSKVQYERGVPRTISAALTSDDTLADASC